MEQEDQKMKEFTQYQCELCKTMYNDAATATRCEKSHVPVSGIAVAKYRSMGTGTTTYPYSIVVTMEDGEQLEFKR